MVSFFDKIIDIPILILGDVMIDRYINGKVTRISPEAPVPIVEFRNQVNRLGGAANVALNIKALGAKPILVSMVGDDENAAVLEQLLLEKDIENSYIMRFAERQTTVKSRIMSGNQQLLRIDREDTHDISATEQDFLFEKIVQIIENQAIKVIVFQDYNKGLLTEQLITRVSDLAFAKKIPIAVDPKQKNFFAYKNATLFKPNLKEITEALQIKKTVQVADLEDITKQLNALMPHQNTMITLSEKGIFTSDGAVPLLQPTTPRNIADVCGAGDTVIAVAALGLAVNMPIAAIAQLANIAGGQVCEEVGVVPVRKEKLMAEYENMLLKG
jgi:D-glycero-beta-D-manno-heptose-7-phosphate kinase